MIDADSNPERGSSSTWSVGTAAGAAVAASACCTIPLALVSVGAGGAWIGYLTFLAPYRWVFVAVAVGALAYAGYNEWDLHRRPDCDCETVFSSGTRRSLLGIATLAVAALIVSPWLVAPSPSAATHQVRSVTAGSEQAAGPKSTDSPASFQQVVLKVEGMTCTTCPVTVQKALEAVDGVYNAHATLKPPRATVRFDPSTVSATTLTVTTQNVGFRSTIKSE